MRKNLPETIFWRRSQSGTERNPWFELNFYLTKRQTFFAWRLAYHGNKARAVREVYETTSGNPNYQSSKARSLIKHVRIVEYVYWLQEQHRAGKLDLSQGPWEYFMDYGFGNPIDIGNSVAPLSQEIRHALHRDTKSPGSSSGR